MKIFIPDRGKHLTNVTTGLARAGPLSFKRFVKLLIWDLGQGPP